MKSPHRTAALLVALLLLSSSTPVAFVGFASANGTTPTAPADAPGVNATETAWTPGTDANVTVAYNVTGASDPANTTIWLQNDSGFAVDYDADLTADAGRRNLTFGPGSAFADTVDAVAGDRRVWVRGHDGDESRFESAAVGVVNTTSSVRIESYSLASTTVSPGVETTVAVTLNNTGGAATTFRVAAYPETGDADAANVSLVDLGAGAVKTVQLPVVYTEQYAGETVNFTVNDEAPTTVTVSDAAPTPSVAGDCPAAYGSPCVASPADVTAMRGDAVSVPVRFNLTGAVTAADANLSLSGPNGLLAFDADLGTANGTATLTLPARAAAGSYRVEAGVVNDSTGERVSGSFSMTTVTVVGNTSVGLVNVPETNLTRGRTHEVTVRVDNTGETVENHTVSLYPGAFRTTPVGTATVTVRPGQSAQRSVNVTFPSHFDTSKAYALSTGGYEGPTVTLEPLVEMTSLTHVGGAANTSALGTSTIAPTDDGGLLQFDLTYEAPGSDRPQNLNGSGLDETSRFEVVLDVPHSYEPSILVATAHDVSWDVVNRSDGYEVTVVAQPIDAAYKVDGPASVSGWDDLSASEDVATHAYTPMFSLAFVDNGSTTMRNVSGMVVATDAQSATAPYPGLVNGSPTLNVDLGAPHETVDGRNNTGQYEATVPSALLDQWGVSDPSTLGGTYKGDGVSLSPNVTADGDVRVGFPTTYSTGTVQLSPDTAAIGASGGESGTEGSGDGGSDGGSAGDTDGSTADGGGDTDGGDGSSGDSDGERETNATAGGATVVATATADGRAAAANVTDAPADETVTVHIPSLNASATAANATDGANATESANASTGRNATADADRSDERSQVRELGLNLSEGAAELSVTVASHDAVPDGTPALNPGGGAGDADGDGRGDGAIDYVSIDLAGTTDDAVENATITFEVPASKLEARGVSPDEVRLYRFHDGEWRTLNTTALGNGTYEAVTPGFSVFAVGSENATENAADDASATTEDEAAGTTATGTDAGGTATPDPSDASAPTAADETETTETGAPGFGVLAAFAALLAVTTRVLRR